MTRGTLNGIVPPYAVVVGVRNYALRLTHQPRLRRRLLDAAHRAELAWVIATGTLVLDNPVRVVGNG